MFTLQRTRIQNMQFAVYISDTPVTLKQSQDHQSYNANEDAKRGYNHATLEKFCFNSVCQKVNVNVFVKSENSSIIFLEYVQK